MLTDITVQGKLNPNLALGESPEATQFIPQNPQKIWASLKIEKDRLKQICLKVFRSHTSPSDDKGFSLEREKQISGL